MRNFIFRNGKSKSRTGYPYTLNLPVSRTLREVGKLNSAVQLPSLAGPTTRKIQQRLVMQPTNDKIPCKRLLTDGNQLTNGIRQFSYLDETWVKT